MLAIYLLSRPHTRAFWSNATLHCARTESVYLSYSVTATKHLLYGVDPNSMDDEHQLGSIRALVCSSTIDVCFE